MLFNTPCRLFSCSCFPATGRFEVILLGATVNKYPQINKTTQNWICYYHCCLELWRCKSSGRSYVPVLQVLFAVESYENTWSFEKEKQLVCRMVLSIATRGRKNTCRKWNQTQEVHTSLLILHFGPEPATWHFNFSASIIGTSIKPHFCLPSLNFAI